MSWTPYDLDHLAQGIVIKARERILEIEKSSRTEKEKNEKLKEARDALNPVSYTHLTLPTNREV